MLLLGLFLAVTGHGRPSAVHPDSVAGAGVVSGIVRADSTGEAVEGIAITASELDRNVLTDSHGRYTLPHVPSGIVHLFVRGTHYRPLDLTVFVPPDGTVHVDVTLSRGVDSTPRDAPLPLSDVHIVAVGKGAPSPPDPVGDAGWSLDHQALEGTWLRGDIDAFRALSSDPSIKANSGAQTLVDHGSAGNQMLVAVDGIPLWNPYHASGVSSAVSPDAIGSATRYDGPISAQYDGRLSGALDIRTPTSAGGGLHVSGALSPYVARTALSTPLPLDSGSLLLTARHHTALLPMDATMPIDLSNAWDDLLATVRGKTPVGLVEIVGFASHDRLSTHGTDSPEFASAITDPGRQSAWASGTIGLIWRRSLSGGRIEGRVWTSQFSSRLQWPGYDSDDGVHVISDGAQDLGSALTFTTGSSQIGMSFDRLATAYDAHSGAEDTSLATPWQMRGNPTIIAAFAEHEWGDSGRTWGVTAGLRGSAIAGSTPRLEPRLSASVAPLHGLWLTLGYARLRQFVQSFHNAESPLASLLGPDLPVAAGSSGIGAAQSDQLTATASKALHSAVQVTVDAYEKRFANLTMVSAQAVAPFRRTEFSTGHGDAEGLGITVKSVDEQSPLRWKLSYGLGQTTVASGGTAYHPSYEQGNTGAFTGAYRLAAHTTVRVGAFAAVGIAPTAFSPVQTDGEDNVGVSDRDSHFNVFGTNTGPLLNNELQRLPPSIESDFGVEQGWRRLTLFTGLGGIIAPSDWWTLMQRSGEPVSANHLQLRAGIQWGF